MPGRWIGPAAFAAVLATSTLTCRDPVTTGASRVDSLSVEPQALTLRVGDSTALRAIGYDAGGDEVAVGSAVWSSSDDQVVTVSATGVATAVAVGSAQVAVSKAGHSGIALVTVTQQQVSTVSVAPSAASIAVGGAVQLSASTLGADGSRVRAGPAHWSASSAGIVRVTASGLVTGLSVGSAIVRATVAGAWGDATITVTSPAQSQIAVPLDFPTDSLVTPAPPGGGATLLDGGGP